MCFSIIRVAVPREMAGKLECVASQLVAQICIGGNATDRVRNRTDIAVRDKKPRSPVAYGVAQTGRIDLAPIILAVGIICWVAGFDLIYATQDYDFDRREGIHSLVVRLGVARSLRLAQLLHLLTFAALIGFGLVAKLGAVYFWAMPIVAAALFYEHKIATNLDLAGINRAFFQTNAFVSAVFLIAVCVDRLA